MPSPETARTSIRARRRQWPATVRLWHRRIGLAVSVLLAILALTGVLLNHSQSLGLDRTRITYSWLADWYGLRPVAPPVHYRVGEAWASWIDGAAYLHGRRVSTMSGEPVGAVEIDSLVLLATSTALALVTPDGELVERVGVEFLPGAIRRIGGTPDGRVAIQAPSGRFVGDSELLTWNELQVDAIWSERAEPPKAVQDLQLAAFRGGGLPVSRVLLDLHSGRLFGSAGVTIVDITAILLVVLVGTGLANWVGRRTRRR